MCLVLPFCASAARMYRCDIICWDMAFSPTVSDIKISATHFEKRCGRCLHGSRQELQFFRPAVVKFTQMFISSPEHHPTLLPFLPLMLDPASQRIYYQRRSHPRASQVARLRSQMVWHLCIVSIVRGDAFHTRSGNWTSLEYNIE